MGKAIHHNTCYLTKELYIKIKNIKMGKRLNRHLQNGMSKWLVNTYRGTQVSHQKSAN